MRALSTMIGFARPHTVVATTVQVVTLFLIVGGWQALVRENLGLVGLTLSACLALNLYVVGLNQLTDIAIDQVNKPWLPLAAGTLTPAQGRAIVAGAGILALGLAAIAGMYMLLTVVIIMLIGSAYSLPPLRLKRFPLAAAGSIAVARGVLANVGLALHYRERLGGELPLLTLGMLGLFFFGFGLVIAIYKDIPDDAGDSQHAIETFTTRLGKQRALELGRAVLTACYALPILFALASLPSGDALFLLVSHAAMIGLFWAVSGRVNLGQQRSISSFYMFLWALFYAEFVVLSVYELARVA